MSKLRNRALVQCFPNLSEGLVKHRPQGPASTVSDSKKSGVGVGASLCISNKLPDDLRGRKSSGYGARST